jgi:cytochrome d ubiquinol oxidase subunit I
VSILAVSDLLLAREQMAFTLGFHIVFAWMGIGFPAITLVANWWGLRKGDDTALRLAQRWSRAMAVLFAVGAVVWGWRVAQRPDILPGELTIDQAAAPPSTLTALFVVFGAALIVVLPALGLLLVLHQRGALDE